MDLTVWKIMAWMTPRAKAAMGTGTASAATSKPLTDDHRDASCMVDSTREAGRDGTLRRAGSVNRATTGARIPRPRSRAASRLRARCRRPRSVGSLTPSRRAARS